jgi:hypothetical protein
MPARERRGDRRRHAETRRTDNTSRSVSKTITMTSCRCVSVMYLRQQRERERERCRWYEKRHLFAPFLHLKTIKLPRQARDKHRESSTRKREIFAFFGAATRCAAPHRTWGAGLRDRYRRLRQEQPARSDPVRDGAGSALLLLLLRLLLLFLLRFASSSNGGNGRQHGSHHGCCGGRLLRVPGSAAVDPEHEVRETPFLRRFYI